MTLISSNIKSNILKKLDDIIKIEDPNWSNLGIEIKLKIIHNLCNFFKNNGNESNLFLEQIQTTNSNSNIPISNLMNIPLKNQRPKKIIELCGINKQTHVNLFNDYKKEFITINREFRKIYNSKNKFYCFGNLSNSKLKFILENYNKNVYEFINKNIESIDSNKLFSNLIGGNQHKIINHSNNHEKIKINKISYIEEFLNIEFNNQINIQFELYLTSEKITSNIPAKYKIFLTNIF